MFQNRYHVLKAVENTQRSSKGSNHSRSKQRTDQRVLVLTLKFLALKKNWFSPTPGPRIMLFLGLGKNSQSELFTKC